MTEQKEGPESPLDAFVDALKAIGKQACEKPPPWVVTETQAKLLGIHPTPSFLIVPDEACAADAGEVGMKDHVGTVAMQGSDPIVALEFRYEGRGLARVMVKYLAPNGTTDWTTFFSSFNLDEARYTYDILHARLTAPTTAEPQKSASTTD